MKRIFLMAAMGVGVLFGSMAPSMATQIDGSLSFGGVSSFTRHEISFANPFNAVAVTSGSLDTFGTCLACMTFTTPINLDNFSPGSIYTGVHDGVHTAFDATALMQNDYSSSAWGMLQQLSLTFAGMMSLDGFDNTPGFLTITANEVRIGHYVVAGTMSGTAVSNPVPEPASMALLGMGLIGIGMVVRRKRNLS